LRFAGSDTRLREAGRPPKLERRGAPLCTTFILLRACPRDVSAMWERPMICDNASASTTQEDLLILQNSDHGSWLPMLRSLIQPKQRLSSVTSNLAQAMRLGVSGCG